MQALQNHKNLDDSDNNEENESDRDSKDGKLVLAVMKTSLKTDVTKKSPGNRVYEQQGNHLAQQATNNLQDHSPMDYQSTYRTQAQDRFNKKFGGDYWRQYNQYNNHKYGGRQNISTTILEEILETMRTTEGKTITRRTIPEKILETSLICGSVK